MTDKQSKALRLADELDKDWSGSTRWQDVQKQAAAELRRLHERETELAARLGETIPALEEAAAELDRLHELNVELVEALREAAENIADWGLYASEYFQNKHDLQGDIDKVNAVIAKAEGK